MTIFFNMKWLFVIAKSGLNSLIYYSRFLSAGIEDKLCYIQLFYQYSFYF